MENIIQEIMKRLDMLARSECFEKSKNLDSYEKVKGDLFIRLMNVVKYRDELKNAIFRTVGGYCTGIICPDGRTGWMQYQH